MKCFFATSFSFIFALLSIVSWVHADNDNEVRQTCKPPEIDYMGELAKCIINKKEFALRGKTIELFHENRAICKKWFKDGVWISFGDDRFFTGSNDESLGIRNLNLEDTGLYTCLLAFDFTSYPLYSIQLEVQSPPYFTHKPKDVMIVKGASTELRCEANGVPKPTIKWLKDGKELRYENYEILETGDLQIRDAHLLTSGDYTCVASNEYGSAKTSAKVIVQKATKITEAPESRVLDAGHTVMFRCKAFAYNRYAAVRIDWLRNGQPIDIESEPRAYLSNDGSELTIIKVRKADAGTYTCVATTEIDEVRAEADLVIYDVPNAPTLLRVDCGAKEARVTWNTTSDSHWPVTHYTIEYNNSFTPESWEMAEDHIPAKDHTSIVKLSPWANYTFRVIAWNKMGESEPSLHSSVCTTTPDVPYKNPDNVMITYSYALLTPVIEWNPMPQIQHNAPKFMYRVYYKHDIPGENWTIQDIDSGKYGWYIKETENKSQRYKIKVVAVNAMGECKEEPKEFVVSPDTKVPSKASGDFSVKRVISGKTALLTLPDQNLRGKLRTYIIETWTEQDGNEFERRIYTIETNDTSILFDKLIPQRENFIIVIAQWYTGPASKVMSVVTPEAETTVVQNLEAHPINFTTMMLKWEKPSMIKGILLGYKITCKKVNGSETDTEIVKFLQEDHDTMSIEISGLSLKTIYRFTVHATTTAGDGPTSFVEKISSRRPIKPTFKWQKISEEGIGKNRKSERLVDIKIIRDVTMDDYYFNSSFFVEYQVDGSETRKKTKIQKESNEIVVSSLETGHTYEVYVIAFDQGYFVQSDPQKIDL